MEIYRIVRNFRYYSIYTKQVKIQLASEEIEPQIPSINSIVFESSHKKRYNLMNMRSQMYLNVV